MSTCFLVGAYLVGNDQFAIVATFTAAAVLGIADLTGELRDRMRANLAMVVAGAVLLAAGTAVSTNTALATVTMFAFALGVGFTTVFSGYFAAASNAVIIFYVVATGIEAPPSAIAPRELGLLFGGALSLVAAGWFWPSRAPSASRAALADLYLAMAGSVGGPGDPGGGGPSAGGSGPDAGMLEAAVLAAERAVAVSAWQPGGLARRQKARMYLLQGAERLVGVIGQLSVLPDAPTPSLAAESRALVAAVATELRAVAASLTSGGATLPDPRRIEEAKVCFGQAAERYFEHCVVAGEGAGDPAPFAAHVFTLHELSWGAMLATVHCRVVFDAPLEASARTEEEVLVSALTIGADWRATWLRRAKRNLTFDSVHLRNSLRLATGLALARLVVGLLDLQHGFWVGFATLLVVKTSAAGTRATAAQATIGTAIGFLASLGLVLTVGVHAPLYAIALPLVAFAAFYLPGAVSFVLGQAFFTVTIVVLFNLIKPEGWSIGIVRLEDVLVGAGIGLVIGLAVWPQGAGRQLASTVATLVSAGGTYAAMTTRGRIGTSHAGDDVEASRHGTAVAAMAAEDMFSQYLAEPHPQGEPVVAWSSIMAVAHRVWFGASVIEIVPVPPGCSSMQPELTRLVDDGAGVAYRNHMALAEALARRTTLVVEEPEGGSVEVPSLPGGALAAMKLLELRAWTDELDADTRDVVPAVAAVAVPAGRSS